MKIEDPAVERMIKDNEANIREAQIQVFQAGIPGPVAILVTNVGEIGDMLTRCFLAIGLPIKPNQFGTFVVACAPMLAENFLQAAGWGQVVKDVQAVPEHQTTVICMSAAGVAVLAVPNLLQRATDGVLMN